MWPMVTFATSFSLPVCNRNVSSLHLQGSCLQRCSQCLGRWTEKVDRKDGVRTTCACVAAPNSSHPW
jgi:hypothetical protein